MEETINGLTRLNVGTGFRKPSMRVVYGKNQAQGIPMTKT